MSGATYTSSRPLGGRALRALAVAMIVLGALALADAVVTLVWQEPFSALYALLRQDRLSGELRSVERVPPTPTELRTLAGLADERRRIAYLAEELDRHTAPGGPVGRIEIPRIGASYVVVKGAGDEELKSGPGVYPETPFPGAGQTTAIAGHRTTYLAPFRHIDELRAGNTIGLRMPYAQFAYVVTGSRVVAPTDVEAAVANVGYSRLVLSACTPLFSAAKRLLVFARLVRVTPRGAARVGDLSTPIEVSPGTRAGAPVPSAPARRRELPNS